MSLKILTMKLPFPIDSHVAFDGGFLFTVPPFHYKSEPSCSKLTTSLVNVSLKFQTFISEICQHFMLKKCEKLLH